MCSPSISQYLFASTYCACFCVFVLFLSFHFTLTSTVLWSLAPLTFSYLAAPEGIYLTVLLLPPLFSEIIFLGKYRKCHCAVRLQPHMHTHLCF